MRADAKQALNQTLQDHVEDVNGSLWVGNRRGLDLTGLLHRSVLEGQITEVPLLKLRITSLEDHVSNLTSSLASYRLLRNRFISTFKRDKLGNATDINRKNIETGIMEETPRSMQCRMTVWTEDAIFLVSRSCYLRTVQRISE